MLIRMRAPRVLQDAGQETPLNVDQVYDLPDVIAGALIATGVAMREPHDAREIAAVAVPERKAKR